MKTLLTKGRKLATVDIDGDQITVQELSLADSQSLKREGDDEGTATLRLIVASIVDAEGHKVYTDEDVDALHNVSLATLKKLGQAISDLNGFAARPKV